MRAIARLNIIRRSALLVNKQTTRCFSNIYNFDKDSVIEKKGDLNFNTFVTDRYSIGDAPNGGYLMYLAIMAAKNTIEHPDPLSMTAYYVSKAVENESCDVSVRVIAKSRSSSTVHVTMSQGGITRSEYLGVFGNLEKAQGLTFSNKPILQLPVRSECMNATKILRKFGAALKIANEFEVRVPHEDPFAYGFFQGKKGKLASLSCWVSFGDKRPPCLPSLAFFLDALPPPVLNVRPTNWVPTLEYSVHFWAKPNFTPDESNEENHWLRGKFETSFSQNGMLHTDGEVWSADGKTLLATSRQLARVLEPKVDPTVKK